MTRVFDRPYIFGRLLPVQSIAGPEARVRVGAVSLEAFAGPLL